MFIESYFPFFLAPTGYFSRRKWKCILWHLKRWPQFWKRPRPWWTCRRDCFTCRQCIVYLASCIHHEWDSVSCILLHVYIIHDTSCMRQCIIYLLDLQAISKEEPNCTLVTRDRRRTEVQHFLLATIFFNISSIFLKYGFYLFTGAVIPPGSRQPVSCQHPLPSRCLVLSI